MAKYITFANRKGGVGKSSLLTMTATAMHHRTKKRVLVIDCDPQATIHRMREDELSTYDDLPDCFDIQPFSFIKRHDADVPVLRFTKVIESAEQNYDIVFIDAPGTMEGEVIPTILTISDAVALPIIGSMLDISSTVSFLSLIEDVNKERGNDLQVIGVINKKDRSSEYKTLDELEGVAGMHLLNAAISNRVQYRRISTVSEVVNAFKDHEFNDYFEELCNVLKI